MRTNRFVFQLFALIAVVAVLLAPAPAPEPYTQIHLLGASGTLSDLPQDVAAGELSTVKVVVQNQMGGPMEYELTIGIPLDGQYYNHGTLDWDSTHTIQPGDALTYEFSLAKGASFVGDLSFRLESTGRQQLMFDLTGPGVSEQVWLWIVVA